MNKNAVQPFFNGQIDLVQRICNYIEANLEAMPTLADLSAHVNVSPFHLQRTFKRVTGISPRQYAEARRLDCLKRRLRRGENITAALYEVGYSSSSRLYERSDERLGMTPATYSRGGEGMRIGYTIVDCHMGRLLVATTERGICAVHLGRNDDELEDCLRNEYPSAHIERNKVQLCDWVVSLLDYINGSQPHLDLPLDVQATAFQWRVWQELLTIPYGETRTYGEIAAAIGQPKAIGAVAQACHANRTVVIIPCHRASRQDGTLGSYRDREAFSKQALLENELEQARRDKRKSL